MKGNALRSFPLARERAHRRIVDFSAALHVGIAEVSARVLATADPDRAKAGAALRTVRVSDISDTGLRIDGLDEECFDVAPGDVVALSTAPGDPLMLGTVVRIVPNVGPGRIVIGVRRMPAPGSRVVPRAAYA